MNFDLNRITFLLYQANGRTVYGKAISGILALGNYKALVSLQEELRWLLETWPEVLRTVWNPAELNELRITLTQ